MEQKSHLEVVPYPPASTEAEVGRWVIQRGGVFSVPLIRKHLGLARSVADAAVLTMLAHDHAEQVVPPGRRTPAYYAPRRTLEQFEAFIASEVPFPLTRVRAPYYPTNLAKDSPEARAYGLDVRALPEDSPEWRVLKAMRGSLRWYSLEKLTAATSMSRTHMHRLLQRLTLRGWVVQALAGRKGGRYRYRFPGRLKDVPTILSASAPNLTREKGRLSTALQTLLQAYPAAMSGKDLYEHFVPLKGPYEAKALRDALAASAYKSPMVERIPPDANHPHLRYRLDIAVAKQMRTLRDRDTLILDVLRMEPLRPWTVEELAIHMEMDNSSTRALLDRLYTKEKVAMAAGGKWASLRYEAHPLAILTHASPESVIFPALPYDPAKARNPFELARETGLTYATVSRTLNKAHRSLQSTATRACVGRYYRTLPSPPGALGQRTRGNLTYEQLNLLKLLEGGGIWSEEGARARLGWTWRDTRTRLKALCSSTPALAEQLDLSGTTNWHVEMRARLDPSLVSEPLYVAPPPPALLRAVFRTLWSLERGLVCDVVEETSGATPPLVQEALDCLTSMGLATFDAELGLYTARTEGTLRVNTSA